MPVTLDDVLYNRKPEPFTLRALFAYLDQNMATELLDFWVSALDLRNMFEPEHPRSSYSMNKWTIPENALGPTEDFQPQSVTPSVRMKLESLEQRHTEAQLLVIQTYVDDDSALCINISDEQRHSIMDRAPKSLEDPPTPGLFDLAMTECERLIDQNYFRSFRDLAEEHAMKRAAMPVAVPPPPKPRASQVLKGQLLSREDIARLVPKEPPPSDETKEMV